MPRITLDRRRSRMSCSLIALATVMVVGASPAAAQSFAGSGSFAFGTGSITTSPNTTSISVTSPTAVINWSPTDNVFNNGVPIVFQPAGTTANFSGGGNYAVLNNINVADFTRVVQLNGTIQNVASGALSGTGSIYFYSPSGFMLGGTSIINLPSLVLSALPIAVDGSGNFITGTLPDRSVTFGPAVNAGATITTATGSQITANLAGSYVAMVAPRIVHNGNITVNGSAALVAAEAATINFSTDGLFDVQVTVGTTDSAGLNIHGDIGGPTPTGSSDKQGIYLVAVPKNDALTMVIGNGADLGFTLANSAVDDNGVIVLSAGHDITNGAIGNRSAGHGASATGNFWFTGAHATSNLFGEATGSAYLYSIAPSQLTTTFDNDVTVHAGSLVSMQSSGVGASLTVAGNVSLSADRTGAAGQSVTAGDVSLFALNSGTLSIAGTTNLSADAVGGNAASGTAGSGTGGGVSVFVDDDSTLTLSNLTTTATGTGGNGLASGVNAGSGTGGELSISAGTNSTLNMNSALLFDAQGYGGSASGAGLAGTGTGGSASVFVVDGGDLNFISDVTLSANGFGGSHATGAGGAAYGGTAMISAAGNGSITINGIVRARSNGFAGAGAYGEGGDTSIFASGGGDVLIASLNATADGIGGQYVGSAAGAGQGGNALIQSSGAGSTITVNATPTTGTLPEREMLSADGQGGSTSVGGTTGGTGTGGTAEIMAFAGGSIALPTTGADSMVRARGYGGIPTANNTTGGLGIGGYLDLRADGGTVTGGNLQYSSIGQGGEALTLGYNSTGGNGTGGERHVNVLGGGVLTIALAGGVSGGVGGDGTGTGNGGSGSGGLSTLTVDNATANFIGTSIIINQAAGGDAHGSGNAGNATGGTTTAVIRNGGVVNVPNAAHELRIVANAFGGVALGSGSSGSAQGGDATLTIQNGSFNGGMLAVSAAGQSNGGGSTGGNGTGGNATLTLNSATINAAAVSVRANGFGGFTDWGVGDLGGDGTAGTARLESIGGTNSITTANGLNVLALGQGGSLYGGGGVGGDGTGGDALLYVYGGSTLTVTGNTTVDASGAGGSVVEGGAGGNGQGGMAEVGAFGGGLLDFNNSLTLLGMGTGGYGVGAAGGSGTGYLASLFVDAGTLIVDGNVDLDAGGAGGDGTTGGDGTGGGEFDVNDLGAHIYALKGAITINGDANVTSSGLGGDGSGGGAGGDGQGGYATIHAANSNSGPSSVTINSAETTAYVKAEGVGGDGGAGTNGLNAGAGGAGGNGAGGFAAITAGAGNGAVTVGSAILSSQAWGGHGGHAGGSEGGSGANGGVGGNASGGSINVGTASGSGQASGSNLGVGTYGTIIADSSAYGGIGGDGSGGTTNGNGGDGGDAVNGSSTLLVRGSTVNATTVSLLSNATGGDAGFGYVPDVGPPGATGIGGDATVGYGIHVLVTNRYLIPAQRGTLNAGTINGTAIATAGIGIPNGNVTLLGGNGVTILNSDADIGSLNFNIGVGDFSNLETISGNDFVSIINGTVDVAGTFSLTAPGNLSLFIDQGWLSAATLSLGAGNFIYDPLAPALIDLGTVFADNVNISTDGDFVADADWDVTNTFVVNAPGLIELDIVHDDNGINFTAGESIAITSLDAGTDIDLTAGTTIDTGNITAGGDVHLFAGGAINIDTVLAGYFEADAGGSFGSNNITSDADIRISANGNVTTGHLSAGVPAGESSKALRIDSEGSVLVGNMVALGGIDVTAQGTVTGLNVTTGDVLITEANGAIIYGNISAGLVNPQPFSEFLSVGLDSATSISVGTVDAAQAVAFITSGPLTTGNVTAGGDLIGLVHGDISMGEIDVNGRVLLADSSMFTNAGGTIGDAGDDEIDPEAIFAAAPVLSNGSITISGPLTAGSWATAAAGTNLGYVTIDAGDDVNLMAGNNINGGAIDADGSIFLDAGGAITVGTLVSGESMALNSVGNINFTSANAGIQFDFDTDGSITGGNVVAGNEIGGSAQGSVTLGNLTAGPPNELSFSVGIQAIGNISVGNVSGAGPVGFATQGNLSTGTIGAGDLFLAMVGGDTTTSSITTSGEAGGQVYIGDDSMFLTGGGTWDGEGDFNASIVLALDPVRTGGAITINGPVNTGRFRAAAGTNLTTGTISSTEGISLDANGSITTDNLVAGDFFLANAGSITTGNIDADSVDMTSTGGDITTFDIDASGDVALNAFDDISTGDITAGSIDLTAGDTITTDDLIAFGSITVDAGGAVSLGNVTTQFPPLFLFADGGETAKTHSLGPSVEIYSDTSVATGNIYSAEDVIIGSGGSITTGWVAAVGFVEMDADIDIGTGYIDAGEYIDLDGGDDISTGNLWAGQDIELLAGDDIAILNATAGTEFNFEAGGDVTGQDIVAGIEIGGEGAGGSVTFGDLTAGFGEGEPEDAFSIGFYAAGPISVGNVNGARSVGFGTQGNLTAGNIQAGDDFLVMAAGNITTGSITTGEGDRVYMAHFSMCATGGGCNPETETDFNPEIVYALDPVATGGSITLNGLVTTGEFDAAAGTNLTTQAMTTSGDIHARAGGTATLNGVWSSDDDIDLASNDIDITASGGIIAADGLGLFSTNATQALIGDGLTGTGYALSNAEFGRISGYDVGIGARGDASAAIDMLIGDLTVTGPLAGSTIEGGDGVLAFAVGDIDSETVSGVIRVNGDIAATGFGSGNAIEFYATRFELDAATGSVSIFSSGSTLGGELGLYADRIHVAEGGILNQLATNPTYNGYQQDLNEAATVQRPEGVLRADTLWIESDNLQDVLIQNTGTYGPSGVPAGFLVRELLVNDDIDTPAGSVNLIINGQVVTEGGTLTGVAARDALVTPEDDVSGATPNSTINGCPLTGECIIRPPAPPPVANVVDNQIDIFTSNPLGDSEFGNEPEIDDGEEGDEGASSPISPPQPLFDTRPLVPASDVNDPVSGTGNPALVGGNECDTDEDAQCGTEKGGGE